MKSIMQEASSVAKAIEQAWIAAGKPQEFTVKVFEEAERNFFGLTTKTAKVAIHFADVQRQSQSSHTVHKRRTYTSQMHTTAPRKEERPAHHQQQPVNRHRNEEREYTQGRRQDTQAAAAQSNVAKDTAEQRVEQVRECWTPDMISTAASWMRKTLETMNRSDVQFNTQANNFHLRITLEKALLDDQEREKNALRSMSFLLLQTLKNKHRRPLNGFKIIISHGQ